MADLMEGLHWLQDVRQHLVVAWRRRSLRRPGKGADYTREALTVRQVVERLHPKQMRLRVAQVIPATPSSKTLHLERLDGPLPPFRPGQYINLFVEVDGVATSRPYSIASSPGGDHLELTVKEKPGGFVSPYLLNDVEVGAELESSGPAGNFYHEPLIDGDDLVFLAGGSGITPFMSILRHTYRQSSQTPKLTIHLLYGSRLAEDVIYGDELAAMAESQTEFTYSLIISEPSPGYQGLSGFLDADLIARQVGELNNKTFYICGPPVMYAFCLAALEELGVARHKIKRELFGPPDDISLESGWPQGLALDTIFTVELEGGKAIRAPAGEPLLNTLERHGLVVPATCRVGECSACRVRLVSGKVFMPPETGIRQADRQHGYIHACVSYPLEDLRIRI